MHAFENLKLKFNCPKKLDELTPCGGAWNCNSCQKMVYDFRGMTEEEILEIFAQSGTPLCGVYDAERFAVPTQKNHWQKWLSAAMVMLGISAIGQKVLAQHQSLVGKVAAPVTVKDTAQRYLTGEVTIFDTPRFPGGFAELIKYIHQKVNYKGKFTGMVLVAVTIETDGSLTNIKILKGAEKELDDKIVDALRRSPKWVPVTRGGKAIKIDYTFGIDCPLTP